ncbi:MAG TPA: DUF126 domain-containing protein [Nitrososphaera sp.]|nr:DUF126 domain-containing protein [Nitrososphaera sp.]
MIISNCKKIVGGSGEGRALVTAQPINFLAMVDPKTGMITDPRHELYEKSLKGAVLVFPYAIGSSVGAYAIYSLREYGSAPSAVVCLKADITTASGCAIANIPVVDLPKGAPAIKQGSIVRVEADSGIVKV